MDAASKREIEQGFAFLRTLNSKGPLAQALKPLLDDLQKKIGSPKEGTSSSSTTTAGDASMGGSAQGVQGIVLMLHQAMVDEGFICIVEKPSSVPGFAGTVRELQPHQLPDGWNCNQTVFAFTYKHRLTTGKHFMLSCSVLMDGSLLAVSVTEKGGQTYGTELDMSEFTVGQPSSVDAVKERVNALVRQLIPQLDKTAPPPQAAGSGTHIHIPPSIPSVPPLFGSGNAGAGTGGIGSPGGSRGPAYPAVGGGDLNPLFPGIPVRPDNGSGSLVGPGHPLFGGRDDNDPFGGGGVGGGGLGPAVPGWMPGLPRPRFDPFGPVAGPHGPNFGNPGFFGPGGGFLGGGDPFGGGRGGGLGPLGPFGPPGGPQGPGGGGLGPVGPGGRGRGRGVTPGEPNPDHLRPPQDDRNDFT